MTPTQAWHRGYDEGRAAADQEFAVCAPPDEYDSLEATEFIAGWHTALGEIRAAAPTTDAVMRARTVLSDEIVRLRRKAALWRAQGGFHADVLDADADELESVREYLRPLDYPSATPADVGIPSVKRV